MRKTDESPVIPEDGGVAKNARVGKVRNLKEDLFREHVVRKAAVNVLSHEVPAIECKRRTRIKCVYNTFIVLVICGCGREDGENDMNLCYR